MPMFDDPKKELNRLQEELLSEETSSWEDELADLDSLLADYEEDRTLPVKEAYRKVDDLHRMSDALLDEEDEDEEDEDLYQDTVKASRKQKEKGVGGLIAVAVVESLAIIGLLVWWLFWLR